MVELLEMRVNESLAPLVFLDNEGQRLSDMVRKVLIRTDDPRISRISELDREAPAQGNHYFFAGWEYHRKYTRQELDSAEAFRLIPTAFFEPVGEMCGTVFDETAVCSLCGAGRRQVSDLFLDLRRLPKSKDIAHSIASEWVVSARLASLMGAAGLTGYALRPVRHKARYEDDPYDLRRVPSGKEIIARAEALGIEFGSWPFWEWLNSPEIRPIADVAHHESVALREKSARSGTPLPVWYQLVVTAPPVRAIAPTRFGIGPFDDDAPGEYRCPLGHISGLNLLSEVTVSRGQWPGTDVACTADLVGRRAGVLMPSPEILVSPRFRSLLLSEGVKGWKSEVAYLA